MFDWLKKLCGKGKFRIEGETMDGREFTIKLPYIGCPQDELEILNIAADTMLVEKGVRVRWMRIVSFYGSGIDFEPTYKRRTAQEIYGYKA